MTSVAKVYRHSDPGAPQLTGQSGSLVALLDAVLVNGYGVGAAAKAGAGWALQFSGTNKRAYRGSAETGSGVYLRIDDSGADPRVARVRAYETMTSIDVGTGLAPTAAQSSGGRVWVKSDSASSAIRPWEIIATDTAFYFFASPIPVASAGYDGVAITPCFAGDINSHRDGDASRFMIMDNGFDAYTSSAIPGFTAPAGRWSDSGVMPSKAVGTLLRSYTQEGSAIPAALALATSAASSARSSLGGAGVAFPDPVSGGLMFERALVVEGAGIIRGSLPGVFVPLHERPFSDGQTIEDLAGLPGTVLRAKVVYAAGGAKPAVNPIDLGQLLFDMSNPW